MKKVAAGLLLVSVLVAGIGFVSPSYARDWKENEIKRSEERNRRRAEEIAKAKSEQEARDKARRIYYEQKRKEDFERRLRYQQKYGR